MTNSSSPLIEMVTPKYGQAALPELISLLQDAVASGASVGFLPPLSEEDAGAYWASVLEGLAKQTRVLLVARIAGSIVGTVQLELATKPNALHRAEIQKLLVLQQQRRQGIGQALMYAIESMARGLGRTLVVLDTIQGDSGEQLYRKLGYSEVGSIPTYAQSATGTLEATVIFYKVLADAAE